MFNNLLSFVCLFVCLFVCFFLSFFLEIHVAYEIVMQNMVQPDWQQMNIQQGACALSTG